uniref:Carboxypeptidase n=1 Tax=Eutreptiella gymnastica TaxID=73025 RepID=A0A7S1NBK7_9EUGL|mmetsp:Transcript_150146/g.262292  ORF Transcript_150146/g.262292 Transcript_150146/m.262292 type:complete len:468 (+) Transcript_150146:3-1406(+)
MKLHFLYICWVLCYASAQLVFQPDLSAHSTTETKLKYTTPDVKPKVGLNTPTLCDPSVKQHSGYLKVGWEKEYFFWLHESRSKPATDPLVLWLTGGPGCSSQLALLAENGPCNMGKDGNVTRNPFSWTTRANVMWVDQPAGTGFSTGLLNLDHDEKGVAQDMYKFLQAFYKALPQYKTNPFYIFGESYAGHYVPAVGHRVWYGNKIREGFPIPLKGIGVGNGLTDPEEQYKWYPDMAKDGGKSEGGTLQHGVITSAVEIAAMKAASYPCVAAIKACNMGGTNATAACRAAYVMCNYAEVVPYEMTGMNPYDMRIKCENGRLCYDFSNVERYLNRPDVQQQLGVSKQWQSCNMIVNALFQGDWMHNYQTSLPDLLASDIKVLIYAGDVDYICNWLGNKKWTLGMAWPHQKEYNAAPDKPFMMGSKEVGRLRTANGFSFLQVYQAGHMVPMDQPEVALYMLDSFIEGKI